MAAADIPAIEVQRADLLDVYMALAAFGRKRAERRADRSTNIPGGGEGDFQRDSDLPLRIDNGIDQL